MKLGLEKALDYRDACRTTYRPVNEEYAAPVNAGYPHNSRSLGERFRTDHPDVGDDVLVEVTSRTHSEQFIRKRLEDGISLKDHLILLGRRIRSLIT